MTFKFESLVDESIGSLFSNQYNQWTPREAIPYNIRTEGHGVSILDIALPGFSLADVEVEVTPDRKLIIRSNGVVLPGSVSLSHFNTGPFERAFSVVGVVTKATMKDGVLSIRIEQDTKPANIKINIEPPSADEHPQLLNEDSVI